MVPKMASQEAVSRNEFPGSHLPVGSQDVAKSPVPGSQSPSWVDPRMFQLDSQFPGGARGHTRRTQCIVGRGPLTLPISSPKLMGRVSGPRPSHVNRATTCVIGAVIVSLGWGVLCHRGECGDGSREHVRVRIRATHLHTETATTPRRSRTMADAALRAARSKCACTLCAACAKRACSRQRKPIQHKPDVAQG